jgi:uncharacterized protein YjaZ
MRAREFITENNQVSENPDYDLPTLRKHQYSVLDQMVKQKKQDRQISSKASKSLDEQVDEGVKAEVDKFVTWCCDQFSIENPPEIELSMDTEEAQGNHHTGGHVPGSGKVWVYANNRNLIDILRTVCHELVHVRQHEVNMIKPGSSYPGSPIEAMADAVAGKYIKLYGAENPHVFE